MKKSNEIVKMSVLAKLAEVEYTNFYAFAIRDEKMVKACFVRNADEILPYVTYCEKNAESHGGVWGVRMLNNKEMNETLKEYAETVLPLCSVDYFESRLAEERANGIKGNRGNLFEVILCEQTGAEQVAKKNAKCTDCGDIVLNGEHIQCKLWNATITTEPQVMRFIAERNAKAE